MDAQAVEGADSSIAPTSLRPRVIQDVGRFSAGSILAGLGGFLNYYAAALLLGPLLWGIWQGAFLAFKYGQLAHLGVLDGLSRELPYQRGKANPGGARALADNAFTFTLLAGGVAALGVALVGVAYGTDPTWSAALSAIAAYLFLQLLGSYFEIRLRAENRFDAVTRLSVLRGIAALLGILPILFAGFAGFLIGQLFMVLGVAAYGWTQVHPRPSLSLSIPHLRTLLSFGIPATVLGLAAVVIATADRVLILRYLTPTDLALYSLGGLLFAPFQMVFSASTAVTYPRLAERWGREGRGRPLINLLRVPVESLSIFLCFLLGLLYVIMSPLVVNFLPSYEAGVPAARVLLFALFLYYLFGFPNAVLLSMGRLRLLLLLTGGFSGVGILLVYLALAGGYGILGVAMATAVAYLFNFCVLASVALRHTEATPGERFHHLARFLAPLFIAASLTFGTDAALPRLGVSPLATSVLQILLLVGAFAYPLTRLVRQLQRGLIH